jgi:hypothetical protein
MVDAVWFGLLGGMAVGVVCVFTPRERKWVEEVTGNQPPRANRHQKSKQVDDDFFHNGIPTSQMSELTSTRRLMVTNWHRYLVFFFRNLFNWPRFSSNLTNW